ncbi:MAG: NAD(P)/FAD-dependent oxidoreductase [Planctomycetes bacterium]|nr:NAD(P)/FAD-dependent oxidoreductase [Planctomycetota bacterium]MCB9889013.1 NAD(P)/FAD-dependent oxidoreductase [Planctomycetota bacterium]
MGIVRLRAVCMKFDVLILGAGPAGSTLATRLARLGWQVGLADRKRFPRPKPCGEFLSPECLPILEDLGVRQQLCAAGAREVRGMRLHGHGHAATGMYRDIGASRVPFGCGYALRREVLDDILLRRALRQAEVVFLEGTTCRGLRRDPSGAIRGATLSTREGQTVDVEATWCVGADGVRSTVARELGVQHRVPWLDKFALTTHFAGVEPRSTAEVHYVPGGYFAAAPVDGELTSVNLVVDRQALRTRTADWDSYFAQALANAPALQLRMQAAERVTPVRGVGPLAFRTTRQAVDGAVLVGDACGYVDPMTGEGIYFALRTAELLAPQLDSALARGTRHRSAMHDYVRSRRREIAPRLSLCSLLQRGLRHDRVTRSILGLLQNRPGLADLIVSITGDYVRGVDLLRPGVWRAALRGAGSRAGAGVGH